MKWIIKSVFIVFIFLCILFGFFLGKAYQYWIKNKNVFLTNVKQLNQLVVDKKNKKQEIEFQLNEQGKITRVVSTKILDKNGVLVGEFFPANHFIVYEDEVPDVLIDALISMEDSRFWKHHGIDVRGILRAFYYNIKYRRIVAGGSTLTQQLAKLLFTSQKRTIFRKFLDMIAAISLEKQFTKKEILMMYLNTVYFGHGIYGLESAAQFYFNKKARNLNYAESAMLIGLLGRPNYFTPFKHPDITRKKQRLVLKRMAKLGYIDIQSVDSVLIKFWNKYEASFHNSVASFWRMNINEAPYYIEYVRQLLLQQLNEDELLNHPYVVETALNLELQEKVQTITSMYMKNINANTDTKQVAVVVFNHHNGFVEAMMGGRKFDFQNQLNRAVGMRRQIGSLIKPFVYSEAMEEQQLTPQSIITDKMLTFRYGKKIWTPHNYDNKYDGPITLETALKKSKNSVSIQLLKKVGVKNFVRKIRDIWGVDVVSKHSENLSLALGTLELSPLEVAKGYGVFGNKGKIYEPIFLNKIVDSDDNLVYLKDPHVLNEKTIFSDETIQNIRLILSQIIKKGGTGYYAAKKENFSYPLFGKTGTTSHYRDAWFCGFNEDYIVVVWIGYDKGNKSLKGSGPTLAAPLVLKIFKSIIE